MDASPAKHNVKDIYVDALNKVRDLLRGQVPTEGTGFLNRQTENQNLSQFYQNLFDKVNKMFPPVNKSNDVVFVHHRQVQ